VEELAEEPSGGSEIVAVELINIPTFVFKITSNFDFTV